jgi:hypothetical protein
MVDIKTEKKTFDDFQLPKQQIQKGQFLRESVKQKQQQQQHFQWIDKSADMYGPNWYGKNPPSYDIDEDTSIGFQNLFTS